MFWQDCFISCQSFVGRRLWRCCITQQVCVNASECYKLHISILHFSHFKKKKQLDLFSVSHVLVYICLFFLHQIDTWCKENNYVIAGYYQANERTKDSRYLSIIWPVKNHLVGVNAPFICPLSHRLNQVAEKVAARISENFNEAAIVMVKHLYVPAISSDFGSSAPEHNLFCFYCYSQVDNSRLSISCFEPIVLIYDHHESKWKSREVTS